jgi:hypothetical protein
MIFQITFTYISHLQIDNFKEYFTIVVKKCFSDKILQNVHIDPENKTLTITIDSNKVIAHYDHRSHQTPEYCAFYDVNEYVSTHMFHGINYLEFEAVGDKTRLGSKSPHCKNDVEIKLKKIEILTTNKTDKTII